MALTCSYMLLYLLASLNSVSLGPQQNPTGGALEQRLGALISLVRSASLAWRHLRLHVVRLVSAIMFIIISIIVRIFCSIIFLRLLLLNLLKKGMLRKLLN